MDDSLNDGEISTLILSRHNTACFFFVFFTRQHKSRHYPVSVSKEETSGVQEGIDLAPRPFGVFTLLFPLCISTALLPLDIPLSHASHSAHFALPHSGFGAPESRLGRLDGWHTV